MRLKLEEEKEKNECIKREFAKKEAKLKVDVEKDEGEDECGIYKFTFRIFERRNKKFDSLKKSLKSFIARCYEEITSKKKKRLRE
jgi:hypothetical protein